jgi:glycosyltransferase involved in cell wall biosynthesis
VISPDRIISLNNVKISRTKIHQTIYLHQSLPFYKINFNFFTETYLWMVKNFVGILIKYSVKRVDEVIVQSYWLKKRVVKQLNLDPQKVQVEFPKLDISEIKIDLGPLKLEQNKLSFIYPAGYIKYKNHDLIINALKLLNPEDLKLIDIKFTLSSNENKKVNSMFKKAQRNNLPISFVGYRSKNEIYDYYKTHLLLFPSEIETFGLPLLEARTMNTGIICLKTDFTEEILQDYQKVSYFNDAEGLSLILKKEVKNRLCK